MVKVMKRAIIKVNLYAVQQHVLGNSLDTSHSVYPNAIYVTEVAVHPEAIIRGLLL